MSMRVYAPHKVLVDLFGHERHDWSKQCDQCGKTFIQCEVCPNFIIVHACLPESLATTPQVPVRQIFQELLHCIGWFGGIILLQTICYFLNSLL